MFFLRSDYEYGNLAEMPVEVDWDLFGELSNWALQQIGEEMLNSLLSCPPYPGPHTALYAMAVYYDLRSKATASASALTAAVIQEAFHNKKNWPTRGYIERDMQGNVYENMGQIGNRIPFR